ncbi:universal stress protein [Hyphobacterium marinum]|uniref:Universal stress protein n=1 Tax=Hyphobacterium marinum TaxID=3116574 RepID=A0ABU7M0Z0_9PROT|nr:universal stress protein [Hyphobacterium sp. Y6023]MEE2567456.1 universal stress protein [Hyphobacterium sp. Y6023]
MARERIIVTLQGHEDDESLTRTASKLARVVDADLEGLFIEPDPSSYLLWTGPGAAAASVVSTAVDAVRDESDRCADAAKASFQNGLEAGGLDAVRGRFVRVSGMASEVASEARLARMMVTDADSAAGRGSLSDFVTAVLIDEQVPVYVARGGFSPPETVTVAWDGSKEAARAVYGAAPFLTQARKVIVLQSEKGIDFEDRRMAPPDRLVDWLSGRGQHAIVRELDPDEDVVEGILDASKGADLIVAGAYGHSRLREFVFGGVTKSLLNAVDGPCLFLAH